MFCLAPTNLLRKLFFSIFMAFICFCFTNSVELVILCFVLFWPLLCRYNFADHTFRVTPWLAAQQIYTFSNSTTQKSKIRKGCEMSWKLTKKQQSNVKDALLVSLLSTLNIFISFLSFYSVILFGVDFWSVFVCCVADRKHLESFRGEYPILSFIFQSTRDKNGQENGKHFSFQQYQSTCWRAVWIFRQT